MGGPRLVIDNTRKAREGRGTGKWLLPDVPHRGWTCVDIEDLGSVGAVCEMCEVIDIRFVHHMEHVDYPDVLGCGCICAGHMEEDYSAALDRERRMKNVASRRARFPSHRGWRRTRGCGERIFTPDGFRVVVFPKDGRWAGLVEDTLTDEQVWSRRSYSDAVEVKRAAFGVMLRLLRRRV